MSLNEHNDVLILDIDRINALSSYVVSYDEDQRAFIFEANNGQNCVVSFIPDNGALGDVEKVYNIIVATRPPFSKKADPGIQKTVCAVLSVFFEDNTRVAFYYCDHHNTFEGRHETEYPYQELRNRLFNIWYSQANQEDLYEKLFIDNSPHHISIIHCRNYPERKKLHKAFNGLKHYLTSDDEK